MTKLITLFHSIACMTLFISSAEARNNQINNEAVQKYLEQSAFQYNAYLENKINKLGEEIVSIGNDPLCDIDINIANIQQVIDNGATEIRLVDNLTFIEDLFISDQSLTIKGGYSNCEDANNDVQQQTRTLINGTGTAPVISISGSSQTHTLIFQNLDIRNGLGSDFFSGGGISTLGSDAHITMENVNVSNNSGSYGGGIAINGGQTSLTIIDSIIQYNTANTSGGGIFCTGSDVSMSLFGSTGILNNASLVENGFTEGGGGLYLTQGCIASVFSGSATQTSEVGISGNSSETNGGGVFLNDGAKLNLYGQQFCFFNVCFGDSSQPVNITNNQAHDHHVYDFYGNGGGIFLGGQETQVFMQGVLINNNQADFFGAGLFLSSGELNITKQSGSCWNKIKCNFFQGNEVRNSEDDETYGGALYVNSGEANISNTVFEDNRADYGTAMHLDHGVTNIYSSVMNNNGNSGIGQFADLSVISMKAQSEINLEHVTIADNNVVNSVIGHNSAPIVLNIYSSIIYNSNAVPVIDEFPYVNSNINCVIAHEVNSFQTLGGSHLLEANPQFKDSAQRNYHIDSQLSPAVDFCPESNVLSDGKDLDGHLRGWDDGLVNNYQNNQTFTYDAGADETYDSDVIFKNEFE